MNSSSAYFGLVLSPPVAPGPTRRAARPVVLATFLKVSVPMVNGSYVPVVGDFSADGFDDIIWYGRGTAPDAAAKGGY